MNLNMKYLGRSGLATSGSQRILQFAPNLDRDEVGFDAPLKQPLRFREAISALHDIVINDLTFKPRDKTAYQQWRTSELARERGIRQAATKQAADEIQRNQNRKPPPGLLREYRAAARRYWRSRSDLSSHLQKHNRELWRKMMPYDPVITVADDVLMFECFSADESSYGCLSVDRDCFGYAGGVKRGTTNVDYSWDLYDHFQTLRTYRETRFKINPAGFRLRTSDQAGIHEEKIDLPAGWLRGFMQLQSAMSLPMRRVTLSPSAIYNLLAFLKRNKAKTSPRAIRFELADGQPPRLMLEPYEQAIDSVETTYTGPNDVPIRIWGRRRLLTLARVLPLVESVDVYLLGTGLPSFWVAKLGDMRLTLGLSGWTTNDWTRGSAVQMLLPQAEPTDALVAKAAATLQDRRSMTIDELAKQTRAGLSDIAGAANQLALRGQAIYDLDAGQFRWRQVLPMALSDLEMGDVHPEFAGAQELLHNGQTRIESAQAGPRGGWILTGKVSEYLCEVLIADDGMIRKGKCLCGWHHKFGVRNGPCRHLQALRDSQLRGGGTRENWFEQRLAWAGKD